MHQVEDPAALPRAALRRDRGPGVVGEPDGSSVLVDGLDLRAAGVAVVAELAEQGVEVGWAGEQRAAGAVAQVVLPAEGRLTPEGAQALAGDEEPGALAGRQLRPRVVDGVEQGPSGLARLGLVDQVGHPRREVGVLEGDRRRVPVGEVLERVHRAGSTQPLPVVVTTIRFLRWKPPARSRSLTASAARDSASGPDASPAYALTGSTARWCVTVSMSAGDGPRPVNVRPWKPRESHGTTEPGPPERRPDVGWCTPSGVVVSRSEKALSATGDQPVEQQPGDDQAGEADDQPPAHCGRGARANPPPQQPVRRIGSVSKAAADEDDQAEVAAATRGETTTRAMS